MKLRSKTMLVLAGVLTFSVALNFGVLQNLVFPSFVSLEESASEQNLKRVEDAFSGEFRSLAAFAADWGHWDDTYQYAGGENDSYEDDNLYFESLDAINLNFMYLFNSSGDVLWGGLYDLETGEELPTDDFLLNNLAATHPLLQHSDTQGLHTSFVLTSLGPVYLVSRPILTSESEGPSRGIFIIGRLLNDAEITRLREQTHVDFRIWPATEASIPAQDQEAMAALRGGEESIVRTLDENTLAGYSLMRDSAGDATVLLRADTPKEITAIGQDTINYALVFMLMVGLVDMIAMWFLLRFVVIGPLTNLTGQVLSIGQAEDHSKRLSLERGDEIGILAREFDSMLDKLLHKEGMAVLGQITATVSHELRNPLGAMRNSVFDVSESTRGKNLGVERALERVDRNIERCDQIIADLLNFARQREPALKEAGIDAWLESALDKQEIPEGITVSRALTAGNAEALIDSEQLDCVIANLIDNACQAIVDGRTRKDAGVDKQVRVESRLAGDRLEISVSDNGPGIPADVLPKIFEPLFSTKGFGIGVGLPTIKRIVEQHGGEVSLTSEPGQGTKAVFWLPLHLAQQAAA